MSCFLVLIVSLAMAQGEEGPVTEELKDQLLGLVFGSGFRSAQPHRLKYAMRLWQGQGEERSARCFEGELLYKNRTHFIHTRASWSSQDGNPIHGVVPEPDQVMISDGASHWSRHISKSGDFRTEKTSLEEAYSASGQFEYPGVGAANPLLWGNLLPGDLLSNLALREDRLSWSQPLTDEEVRRLFATPLPENTAKTLKWEVDANHFFPIKLALFLDGDSQPVFEYGVHYFELVHPASVPDARFRVLEQESITKLKLALWTKVAEPFNMEFETIAWPPFYEDQRTARTTRGHLAYKNPRMMEVRADLGEIEYQGPKSERRATGESLVLFDGRHYWLQRTRLDDSEVLVERWDIDQAYEYNLVDPMMGAFPERSADNPLVWLNLMEWGAVRTVTISKEYIEVKTDIDRHKIKKAINHWPSKEGADEVHFRFPSEGLFPLELTYRHESKTHYKAIIHSLSSLPDAASSASAFVYRVPEGAKLRVHESEEP